MEKGMRAAPDSIFGNVNADVLAHFVPDYQHTDFVEIIRTNPWPN